MDIRRFLLVAALAAAAHAVDPDEVRIRSTAWLPPGTRISVESRLVEIGVTVRDRKGNPVEGLQATDFEVLDDGHPQPITFLSAQKAGQDPSGNAAAAPQTPAGESPTSAANTARSIALYFDDTHAETFGLNRAKVAAQQLLTAGLPAGERVGIFTASGSVTEDFTADQGVLLRALERLRIHPLKATHGIGTCPTLTPYQAYGIYRNMDTMAKEIALQEAIACYCLGGDPDCPRRQVQVVESAARMAWNELEVESAAGIDGLGVVLRHLAGAPGVRILLLMSPGFLTSGMEQRTDALADAAIRARIVVNALDVDGLAAISPETLNDRNGRRFDWAQRSLNTRQDVITGMMASLAPATGGRLIQNTNDFNTAVRRLSVPAEFSYVLGIAPPGAPDERYHALKVRLQKTSGYKIEARDGYFSTAPAKKPETAQDRIDRVVVSHDTPQPFPSSIRVSKTQAKDGTDAIQVDTTVDANGLTFTDRDGRHAQQLTFVTALEDPAGNFLTGKEAVMDLNLKDATLADMRAKGIHTSITLAAPKAGYVVRAVIREAVGDRITAFRQSAETH